MLMRRRASIITFLLVLLTPLVSLAGTQAAWAQGIMCGSNNIRLVSFQWNGRDSSGNRDVLGVRAPIENRTDGALCDISQFNQASADFTWIAVIGVGGGPTAVVQIGIVRLYMGGARHECGFWELDGNGNTAGTFQCDHLTNDTDYYFKIHTFMNGTKYVLSYCGTSGSYDPANCTVENDTHGVFNEPAGQISAESHWSCDLHIFGNSTDQQNVGIPSSNIQGLEPLPGSSTPQWTTRTWSDLGSDCPNFYQHSQLNQGETMKFYDTRNSQ
jgi:hypothetical protein